MIEYFVVACLVIASFFDLKSREIPPILTYSMMLFGLIFNLFIFPDDLLNKAISAAACIAVGFIFYKIGIWAGGDFKLFGGISLIQPTGFFPLILLLVSILSFFPFALIYLSVVLLKSRKLCQKVCEDFWKERFNIFHTTNFMFISYSLGTTGLGAVILFILMLWQKKYTKYLGILVPILAVIHFDVITDIIISYALILLVSALYCLGFKAFGILRENVLREKISVSKLTEGMIPLEDFWLVKNKVIHKIPKLFDLFTKDLKINSRLARGLTDKEISFLKTHKIKEIFVKKSMPFVPVMLLGAVVLLFL